MELMRDPGSNEEQVAMLIGSGAFVFVVVRRRREGVMLDPGCFPASCRFLRNPFCSNVYYFAWMSFPAPLFQKCERLSLVVVMMSDRGSLAIAVAKTLQLCCRSDIPN